MSGIYSDILRLRRARRKTRRQQGWFLTLALAVAAGAIPAAPSAVAGEDAVPASPRGGIMICVREQTLLGAFGPERCITPADTTYGFGPAASWVGAASAGNIAEMGRRRNNLAALAFAPPDLEATARSEMPVAVWMLSYNIKELATTLPDPRDYWVGPGFQSHGYTGFSTLYPGIERNPTGLKALGLRISVPY